MRRIRSILVVVLLLTAVLANSAVSADRAIASDNWLDNSNLENGLVTVNYDVKPKVITKLRIAKGKENYTYDLNAGKSSESFPLQLGNGDYSITILENVSGNKYKGVKQATVKLELTNQTAVYLQSTQNVSWSENSPIVKKAKALTADKKTNEEKAKAIYNYIVKNVAYDYKLAANVKTGYVPNNDQTFANAKGICYDYASLYAGMLRSVGIPTKLVMGDSNDVEGYHAWNEVLINGKWAVVDTTLDASQKKNTNWIKDTSRYEAAKQY